MILVDTNVFVDLWSGDPVWGEWSQRALARAADRGPLGVNAIIYAELCVGLESAVDLENALSGAGVRRLPLPYAAAWPASQAFASYRKHGGKLASPLPEFFIGAHAFVEGIHILTRDAKRYRTYFPKLRLIAPG